MSLILKELKNSMNWACLPVKFIYTSQQEINNVFIVKNHFQLTTCCREISFVGNIIKWVHNRQCNISNGILLLRNISCHRSCILDTRLLRAGQLIKGAGSRNRKYTCYIYNLHCCPLVAIVFCTDFGGWGESTIKLLLNIHQYLCNHTAYERFVCFLTKFESPSSK